MLELGVKSVEEVLLAGMSQALRVTDLRAGLNEVVTASDASEHGGGMVYGARLTSQGLKEVLYHGGRARGSPECGVEF